ncbi:MAG: helical backbone metal receptor [Bacteroidota bacterium]
MIITDQLNRTISLKSTPKRIISLVPSLTELIVDLGLEGALVGVTKFCVHPKSIRKEKAVVGGTKQVHLDKIKKLQPDIIICNKEENTLEMVSQLENICPVHISDILDLEDTLQLIKSYGRLFNVEQKANEIHYKIEEEIKSFKEYVLKQKRLKVAYFIWQKPWMVAGNDTFINTLLNLNSFDNIFVNTIRYPEVSLEEVVKKNPEILMLSSEPYPFKDKHKVELSQRFAASKVIIVDGEYFSWYGSRLLGAFDYFRTLRQELSN